MNQSATFLCMVPVAGIREGITPGLKTSWGRASHDAESESALAHAVASFPLTNEELLADLSRFRPPQRWYDENHEGLY